MTLNMSKLQKIENLAILEKNKKIINYKKHSNNNKFKYNNKGKNKNKLTKLNKRILRKLKLRPYSRKSLNHF